MRTSSFVLGLCFLLFSATTMAEEKNSLHDTFNRIGQVIESDGCPDDFIKPVGDVITKVCGQAKNGTDVEPVKYLKNDNEDAPEIFCDYDDGVYEVIIGDTSDTPTSSQVKIAVSDSGKVTEIVKDELKVEGSVCRDLASKIDKGGRIPASVDTELCFDYYPTSKFVASRQQASCGKPLSKSKKKVSGANP
jgi:hypothetical protein